MRCKILHILMMATLVSVSVPGHSEPVQGASEAGYGRKEPRPGNDFKVERAYTKKRWIGLLNQGIVKCPEVANWNLETLEDQVLGEIEKTRAAAGTVKPGYRYPSLFPENLPKPAVDRKPLETLELDRYCIYTALTSDLRFRPDRKVFAKAQQDRLALSITSAGAVPSDDLGRRIWPTLARHFRSQTGQVAPDETPALSLSGVPSVRLTFIDSQPDGEWPPVYLEDGSQHGFTLAHMAHGLVCPAPGSCAADIKTRRALSYRKFYPLEDLPPTPEVSGHVGLVSDLATAIYAEVLYWRQFEPDKKLILNLSLGWDGEAFKDLEKRSVSTLEPSARAVYKALRFARRSGALVIAAAGNQRGGGNTDWPLLPAAWELRRPNLFRWAFWRKPVYAVGGVEWQGLPIPNSRKGGWPRRAAYADHSVTGTPDEPTAMYTGTSVSAAVASSIAAVVWHLRPELRPAQVMRLITRSGDKLGFRADFYGCKPLSKLVQAPYTRRLSLCPAVERACGQDGRRCQGLASPPKCIRWDGAQPPRVREPLERVLGRPSRFVPYSPIEDRVDIASQRWVIPQPEATPCPGCTVVRRPIDESSYQLKLQIGEEWIKEATDPHNRLTLRRGTLVITCREEEYSQELPRPTLEAIGPGPGEVYEIPIDFHHPLSECTAQITYIVESATEPDLAVKNPVIFSSDI